MKKTLISIFIVIAFVFISCAKKQDWYCECGLNGQSTNSYTTTITNATKSNASDLCYKAAGSKMPSGSYGCSVSPQ